MPAEAGGFIELQSIKSVERSFPGAYRVVLEEAWRPLERASDRLNGFLNQPDALPNRVISPALAVVVTTKMASANVRIPTLSDADPSFAQVLDFDTRCLQIPSPDLTACLQSRDNTTPPRCLA